MATCTATGAKKIRELLAILKLRAGQRRTKPRMGSRTTGVVAVEKRRKAYTPNPAVSAGQAAKRRSRDHPLSSRLDGSAADEYMAFAWVQLELYDSLGLE